MKFENLIFGLHGFIIFSMLAKFYEDKKSIAMLSIKYLISSVLGLKLCTKNKFIN